MQTAYMSLGEACERLRIPPRTFRQLMADFGDLLEAPRPSADGRLQELSVETVDQLHDILQLRSRGVPVEAIRARLAVGPLGTEADWLGTVNEVAATADAATAEPPPEPQPEPATVQMSGEIAPPAMSPPVAAPPSAAQSNNAPAVEVPAAIEAAVLDRHADLLNKLERLTHELSQSEQRRVDDRDRLLTVLMRTQVEIQQLRHEMAAQASRRDRKQPSWVARWFA